MAVKTYIGDTNGLAREIKKLYIGDTNGIAREIKKLYVGDSSGIARLIYTADKSNARPSMHWVTSTAPAASGTSSNGKMIWANGVFMLVMRGNLYRSVDDGQTWSSVSNRISGAWGIAYGDGYVVAVFGGSRASYSGNNGQSWTYGSGTFTTGTIGLIEYGNGLFVAVSMLSYGGFLSEYSTDHGNTWEQSSNSLPSTQPGAIVTNAGYLSMAFGSGYFVALGWGSNVCAYSADGKTWQGSTLPSAQKWISVAFGDGVFVAIAEDSNQCAYSTNHGISWSTSALPFSATWKCIAFGGGIFCAIGYGVNQAAYSEDGGRTWSVSTLPITGDWNYLAYGNGKFIALTKGGIHAAMTTV